MLSCCAALGTKPSKFVDHTDLTIPNLFNKHSKTNETITSLYYEMYSPESYSVLSMNTGETGFNPNKNSIYQHINTMFLNIENKQQLEYLKDEEQGIIVVNLGDKVGNTRLRLFQRALETKYDKVNPLRLKIMEKNNSKTFLLWIIQKRIKKMILPMENLLL